MPKAPKVKDMKERLEDIRREIGKLQAQEALLLDMMGKEPIEKTTKRAPKGSVKSRVLEMLETQGRNGLNAAKAVELSEAGGEPLDRGSVSSLLSRLKQDGVVAYDGKNYRLKRYAGDTVVSVTPLRTSGGKVFD